MLATTAMKQVNGDDAGDSSPQPNAQMEIVQDGVAYSLGRAEVGKWYKCIFTKINNCAKFKCGFNKHSMRFHTPVLEN